MEGDPPAGMTPESFANLQAAWGDFGTLMDGVKPDNPDDHERAQQAAGLLYDGLQQTSFH
jgi:hypothetical protein